VVLAADAMTDRDAAAHRTSIERIFLRLGETATTAEILEMLEKTRCRSLATIGASCPAMPMCLSASGG
jgi:isochorismate hydrolase